jgi:SpoVK/Ycf46/Vps4 family AAA+-type ATPase
MALRSQSVPATRYQGSSYRGLLQELKTARTGGTTFITLAGAPRSALQPIAREIAATLGRSLYRIDLSGVVSKYIGETEKNLRRAFQTVDSNTSVLFFDEADSLFGKRTEVRDSHDRYANSETSQLASALAGFRGVIVAALTHPGPEIATTGRVRHVRVKYPPD